MRSTLLLVLMVACGSPPPRPLVAGDRVIVKTGKHAGEHGTIVESAGYEQYLGMKPGEVRVGLDGGRGQTMAEGGAGGKAGQSINIDPHDLASEH